ncbi:MAG TPA: amidase [Erysipelothrix sp.]|nr:amidase [Erysipelothrix sp.]
MRKNMVKILIVLINMSFFVLPISAKVTEALVDITAMSIQEIQAEVDKGMITYETITKIYLDRIEAYASEYDAMISINDKAIEQARAMDVIYKQSGRPGDLFGIPILVKDNIDVAGMPTTAGAKGLINNIAKEDAPAIKNLRDQGVIFIAKTNMDEFAFNASYSKSGFGIVRNAYDSRYTAYGSSGGTAVGVALDLAVAGIGTDTGVSIRVPSSANNLIGLRPTKSDVFSDGVINFESTRDVMGPMAKYTEDVVLLYEGMKNEMLEMEYKDLHGITIGVLASQVMASSTFIQNMLQEQIKELESLGATIKQISSISLGYRFDATNFCYEFNQHIENTEGPIRSLEDLINSKEYSQYIDGYLGYYCNHDYKATQSYQDYLSYRNSNTQQVENQFDNFGIDVLMYPTIQEPLMVLDEALVSNVKTYSYMIAPQTGFPAISVPMGFYESLPYGVEFVAKKNQEGLLLGISGMLTKEYVLPSSVPPLYHPIDAIDDLMAILNMEHKEDEYEVVLHEIEAFIQFYDDVEDKEEKAAFLIEQYEDVPRIIKENRRKRLIRNLIISGMSGIMIVGFGLMVKHKKSKPYQS